METIRMCYDCWNYYKRGREISEWMRETRNPDTTRQVSKLVLYWWTRDARSICRSHMFILRKCDISYALVVVFLLRRSNEEGSIIPQGFLHLHTYTCWFNKCQLLNTRKVVSSCPILLGKESGIVVWSKISQVTPLRHVGTRRVFWSESMAVGCIAVSRTTRLGVQL